MTPNSQSLSGGLGLAGRIKRLAQPVRLVGRGSFHLHGDDADSLLTSLLHELDETVLPRRFKVQTNTGQSVCLHMAGRKLIGIGQSCDKNGMPEIQAEPVKGVIAALHKVFAGATKATLHITRTDNPTLGPVAGHSIAALAIAGAMPLKARPDPDPVPALFNTLVGHMAAWVKIDRGGNITSQDGDPLQVRPLEGLVRESLAEIESQLILSLPDPKQPGCIVLSSSASGGMSMVYARSPTAGFLALLPVTQIASLQRAWRRFYSGN